MYTNINPNSICFLKYFAFLKLFLLYFISVSLIVFFFLFLERPCLQEPKKVEKIQEFYIETLRAYISTNRPPGKNYFARLLSTLVELRTLGNMNSELCFSLKVQNKKLPAFLEEIWDIQQ